MRTIGLLSMLVVLFSILGLTAGAAVGEAPLQVLSAQPVALVRQSVGRVGEPKVSPLAPTVRWADHHDLSPPLRSLSPIFSGEQGGRLQEMPRGRRVQEAVGGAWPPERDPVVQDFQGAGAMPLPNLNFEGVGNVNNKIPSDAEGDVGPDHYVQMVNVSFAIWDKQGNLLYGPADNNTLWSGFGGLCETTNNGDPIVLYDALADRWLMSQLAFGRDLDGAPQGPFYECVAISQTGDPIGAWYRYAFLFSPTLLNDYPKLGVWPDGYYMSADQWDESLGFAWAGAGVLVFERDKMVQGLPARMVYFDLGQVDQDFASLLPADLDGAPPHGGVPNFYVNVQDASSGQVATDRLNVWEFHVDWQQPANCTFGLDGQPNQVLDTAPFNSDLCLYLASCIPQPDVSERLHAISDRVMFRLQYRDFGETQALVTNHTVDVDGADHAGIRWYELRDSGAGWTIWQQGTYAPDGDHRWMGSLALDAAGNLALGYSVSSGTTYPSIRYAGRLASDPLGQLGQGEVELIAGSGSQTKTNRWGDYSMMAVDPSDGCTFWYTQQYVETTGPGNWQTRIGTFRFDSCPGLAPRLSVTKTADPVEIEEPGGTVTFTLAVNNEGDGLLTLTGLVDDVHGDLDGQGTCSVPQEIGLGGSYTCGFQALVRGRAGESETDRVTARAEVGGGSITQASGEATVTITRGRFDVYLPLVVRELRY